MLGLALTLLKLNTTKLHGFDGNSKDTDQVCMSYYTFHLSTLHQQKVTSTDKNIVTLINSNEDKELDRVVNNAVIKTVISEIIKKRGDPHSLQFTIYSACIQQS